MVLRKRLYISGMREEVVDGADIMFACWVLSVVGGLASSGGLKQGKTPEFTGYN